MGFTGHVFANIAGGESCGDMMFYGILLNAATECFCVAMSHKQVVVFTVRGMTKKVEIVARLVGECGIVRSDDGREGGFENQGGAGCRGDVAGDSRANFGLKLKLALAARHNPRGIGAGFPLEAVRILANLWLGGIGDEVVDDQAEGLVVELFDGFGDDVAQGV